MYTYEGFERKEVEISLGYYLECTYFIGCLWKEGKLTQDFLSILYYLESEHVYCGTNSFLVALKIKVYARIAAALTTELRRKLFYN